jgi:hypothetical protein
MSKLENGKLRCVETKAAVPFQIAVGLDTALTLKLESEWAAEKAIAIQQLLHDHPEEAKDQQALTKRLFEYGLTDFHWSWTNKALRTATDEYQWFYLEAEGKVQGVCVIFYPKQSRIDSEQIFYIDYIASAYWNRKRPGRNKRFSNVGLLLIANTIEYATTALGLRPGFCLHSLPTAESYYTKLGMTPYDLDSEKENLRYFEAPAPCALGITGDLHA